MLTGQREKDGVSGGRRLVHMGVSPWSSADNYNHSVSVLSYSVLCLSTASWLSHSPLISWFFSFFPPWIGCPLQDLHFSQTGTTRHHQVSYWCSYSFVSQPVRVRNNMWEKKPNSSLFLCSPHQILTSVFCVQHVVDTCYHVFCQTSVAECCLFRFMWKGSLLSKRCIFLIWLVRQDSDQ